MNANAQRVQAYLVGQGLKPVNFPRVTATSIAAASAVGCSVGEIAKSILMLVGQQPVMIIASGDARVKSGRLKQASGLTGKVRLPDADDVLRFTGYAPGGVSPFLLPPELPVFLDSSLRRFTLVYPAAGTDSSAVALTFSRLAELCGGEIVDVCEIQT